MTRVEVDRARNLLADLEQRAASARQEWRVQSANLTQVLRLDPRAVVEPLEHDHAQVTLIDPARPIEDLMIGRAEESPRAGLPSRPWSRRLEMAAIRREKARPLLPVVQLGGFQTPGELQHPGGGLRPRARTAASTSSPAAKTSASSSTWQLEGFGDRQPRPDQGAARPCNRWSIIEFLRRTQDTVAGEVTRAQARVQSAAARVLQADRALRSGIITFNGQTTKGLRRDHAASAMPWS